MRYVGNTMPIHDAVSKASGQAEYAGDMQLKNMLHMALLFSTVPHGIVKKLDCSKALEVPGVVDIIHCFNTTEKEYNQYHTQFNQPLIHTNRIFNSHVRYVGDRIAGVIAETAEIARKAVSLIEVEYEELPFSLDAYETLTGKIDDVHPTGAVFECGGVKVGEKPEGEDLIEVHTETHLSRINHICMETHVCVADYNRGTGELTIWSPNQTVHGIRSVLGDIFEMDYSKIRVIKTTMGGSFGGKQEWVLEPVAAAAALRVARPVKLVFNRSETITSCYGRSPMHFDTTFTFKKDGTLMGVDNDLLLDAGAYLGNSINYARTVSLTLTRGYNSPYLKTNARVAITNTIIGGAFRGWTSPEATIMFEHTMNEAAKKLGMDPVDIRIKNVMHPGDVDVLEENTPIGNFKAEEALRQGREHFEWDKRKEEIRKFNAENKRYQRGLGVSLGAHVNSFYPGKTDYARVDMRLAETGSVHVNITLHDHGCGTVTAMRMIAAEELVMEENVIRCKANPEIHFTWSEIADKAQQILKHEVFVSAEYVPDTNPGVCGAHFCMVEVDTYTGMTKILDYLAVHDIGQAINREICVAQTQGAVIMGSGAALSEHVITRPNGRPAGSLKDYHVINAPEAPNVRVEFIEDRGTEGPYGAKSIGEVAHTPVTAAVVGAVNDALGSDMNSIPLNPDRIVSYLRERMEQ